MTRRQAMGLLLLAALIAGGQLMRRALLVDRAGRWRDPLWLDSLLPALPAGGDQTAAPAPTASGNVPEATAPSGATPDAGRPTGAAAGGGAPAASRRTGKKPVLTTPLSINTCPADSLQALPGIGPALAARIVAERAAGGPFTSLSDLQRVKGIGPRLAARLAPCVRFAIPPRGAPAAPPARKPVPGR